MATCRAQAAARRPLPTFSSRPVPNSKRVTDQALAKKRTTSASLARHSRIVSSATHLCALQRGGTDSGHRVPSREGAPSPLTPIQG